MKIYKITEASEYLGISINSLKTLANNGKLNSFKTGGEHKELEGECGKLKLLLDSAQSRVASAQTIIKTLDVERSTGGLST